MEAQRLRDAVTYRETLVSAFIQFTIPQAYIWMWMQLLYSGLETELA